MRFGDAWETGTGQGGGLEDPYLEAYHEQEGGLVFTEFNVASPVPGSRQRRLDAIRFPDAPGGNEGIYRYSPRKNHETIARLIKAYPVEAIEVHKWGFYVFGQLVGKRELLWIHWDPVSVEPVLLPTTHGKGAYHPDVHEDPATEAVFEKHGIRVVGIDLTEA